MELKMHVAYYRIPSSLKFREVFGEIQENVLNCLQLNNVFCQYKSVANVRVTFFWEILPLLLLSFLQKWWEGAVEVFLPAFLIEHHILPCGTRLQIQDCGVFWFGLFGVLFVFLLFTCSKEFPVFSLLWQLKSVVCRLDTFKCLVCLKFRRKFWFCGFSPPVEVLTTTELFS